MTRTVQRVSVSNPTVSDEGANLWRISAGAGEEDANCSEALTGRAAATA